MAEQNREIRLGPQRRNPGQFRSKNLQKVHKNALKTHKNKQVTTS